MAAVGGGAVPGLSEIQNWSIEHLEDAAAHWTSSALDWEDTFSDVAARAPYPGGAPWEGEGAEAAIQRTATDTVVVRGAADSLHTAAAAARNGADDISWAKQSALEAIEEARTQGFTVGEDLSVTDQVRLLPAPVQAARHVQAEALAASIRAQAQNLVAADSEVGAQVTSAIAGVNSAQFGGPASGVQGLDFKQAPPSPAPPPPVPGPNAGSIKGALKNLPSGSRGNYLEVKDPDQLKQFADWATKAMPKMTLDPPYRNGQGAMYELPDGTTVGVGRSTNHDLTVDVKYPDGSYARVHVNEKTGGAIEMPPGVIEEAPPEIAETPVEPAPAEPIPEPLPSVGSGGGGAGFGSNIGEGGEGEGGEGGEGGGVGGGGIMVPFPGDRPPLE